MSTDQNNGPKPLLGINSLISKIGLNKTHPPITGLGDVVARITDTMRIPKCSACAERQKKLNAMFPMGASAGNCTNCKQSNQ